MRALSRFWSDSGNAWSFFFSRFWFLHMGSIFPFSHVKYESEPVYFSHWNEFWELFPPVVCFDRITKCLPTISFIRFKSASKQQTLKCMLIRRCNEVSNDYLIFLINECLLFWHTEVIFEFITTPQPPPPNVHINACLILCKFGFKITICLHRSTFWMVEGNDGCLLIWYTWEMSEMTEHRIGI